mmetsp:Transcript_15093/g.46799  ORF Transcript_15093/g.46799 Transcript_15093/m.46799 type:complete len:326 (-) Transcript_15093:4-981(-)
MMAPRRRAWPSSPPMRSRNAAAIVGWKKIVSAASTAGTNRAVPRLTRRRPLSAARRRASAAIAASSADRPSRAAPRPSSSSFSNASSAFARSSPPPLVEDPAFCLRTATTTEATNAAASIHPSRSAVLYTAAAVAKASALPLTESSPSRTIASGNVRGPRYTGASLPPLCRWNIKKRCRNSARAGAGRARTAITQMAAKATMSNGELERVSVVGSSKGAPLGGGVGATVTFGKDGTMAISTAFAARGTGANAMVRSNTRRNTSRSRPSRSTARASATLANTVGRTSTAMARAESTAATTAIRARSAAAARATSHAELADPLAANT